MRDRFGPPPPAVENLLTLVELRILALGAGVEIGHPVQRRHHTGPFAGCGQRQASVAAGPGFGRQRGEPPNPVVCQGHGRPMVAPPDPDIGENGHIPGTDEKPGWLVVLQHCNCGCQTCIFIPAPVSGRGQALSRPPEADREVAEGQLQSKGTVMDSGFRRHDG